MILQHFLTNNCDALVRRKIMPVIFQHEQVERRDEAVGVVARNQIDLLLFERSGDQTEIHDARRLRKAQAVGCDQALVAVRPLHEFVSKTSPPLWRIGRSLGDGAQVEFARIIAANHHRKSVVESQRRTEREAEPAFIALLHTLIDILLVAARLLFENGGQGRAGVFGIEVDASGKDGLMANKGSRQIKTALDVQMSRDSITCANISPRTSCSVKFLLPTTMRSRWRPQPTTGSSDKTMSRLPAIYFQPSMRAGLPRSS